jgi:hypothetical protein
MMHKELTEAKMSTQIHETTIFALNQDILQIKATVIS